MTQSTRSSAIIIALVVALAYFGADFIQSRRLLAEWKERVRVSAITTDSILAERAAYEKLMQRRLGEVYETQQSLKVSKDSVDRLARRIAASKAAVTSLLEVIPVPIKDIIRDQDSLTSVLGTIIADEALIVARTAEALCACEVRRQALEVQLDSLSTQVADFPKQTRFLGIISPKMFTFALVATGLLGIAVGWQVSGVFR